MNLSGWKICVTNFPSKLNDNDSIHQRDENQMKNCQVLSVKTRNHLLKSAKTMLYRQFAGRETR